MLSPKRKWFNGEATSQASVESEISMSMTKLDAWSCLDYYYSPG